VEDALPLDGCDSGGQQMAAQGIVQVVGGGDVDEAGEPDV
jgi:hypothetical protein